MSLRAGDRKLSYQLELNLLCETLIIFYCFKRSVLTNTILTFTVYLMF